MQNRNFKWPRLVMAALAAAGVGPLFAAPAAAQTFDLAISLDSNSAFSSILPTHHDIPIRNTADVWSLDLSTMTNQIPNNAELNALDYWTRSDIYFALDRNATVGSITVSDEDIAYWNGSTFAVAWDGSANGLPDNSELDALDIISVSPLEFTFSLDTDAYLTVGGSSTLVADEDLVRCVAGSGFTVIDFDGSAFGAPANANLDAFGRLTSTQWIMSFDVAETIGALSFDDADLLLFDTTTSGFSLWFDSTAYGLAKAVDIAGVEVNPSQLNPTATPTPTATTTPTTTVTPTVTPSFTPTLTPSLTPTVTASLTPTVTASSTPTASPTPTVSNAAMDWLDYE